MSSDFLRYRILLFQVLLPSFKALARFLSYWPIPQSLRISGVVLDLHFGTLSHDAGEQFFWFSTRLIGKVSHNSNFTNFAVQRPPNHQYHLPPCCKNFSDRKRLKWFIWFFASIIKILLGNLLRTFYDTCYLRACHVIYFQQWVRWKCAFLRVFQP